MTNEYKQKLSQGQYTSLKNNGELWSIKDEACSSKACKILRDNKDHLFYEFKLNNTK